MYTQPNSALCAALVLAPVSVEKHITNIFAKLDLPSDDDANRLGQAVLQRFDLLHRAGVPVVAGTDTNDTAGVPFQPEAGASLHHELELLVDAGLSTVQTLRAATCQTARAFGLTDRGAIEPGLRADLILIDGDPLADIRAIRNIRRIWCGGIERTPAGQDRVSR